MHKLDRNSVSPPACLANYQHPPQTWNDVTCADKQNIRAPLRQMQRERCAYCECAVHNDAHIEHFRRKRLHPHLTFTWDNLFLSCQETKHCGHYKDRPSALAYNPNHLIKPDVDDPDRFFYFHSSGEVRLRPRLSNSDSNRATETIRVFNLDYGPLRNRRERALKQYKSRMPDLLEWLEVLDGADRDKFIIEEIEATAKDPHATVIRHFFEKV